MSVADPGFPRREVSIPSDKESNMIFLEKNVFDNYLIVVVELDIDLSWQPEVALLSDLPEDVVSLTSAADEDSEAADVETVHVVAEAQASRASVTQVGQE